MYLSKLTIENFRCFGEGSERFQMTLRRGVTALVGENDAGKTALIDALRFVLGTTDQEWYPRLEDSDFHLEETNREIRIVCEFKGLTPADKRAFVEYLTYGRNAKEEPILYINWTAKDTGDVNRGRPYRRVEVNSGKNGDGPSVAPGVRELLRATYLRPLRDAERALASGRGSRLSQILRQNDQIKGAGEPYSPDLLDPKRNETIKTELLRSLSVLGIGDLANDLLQSQEGVVKTRGDIDFHLKELALSGENIGTEVKVSGATSAEDIRLRRLLEKLDLSLGGLGKLGLGSNNLLFMACELLLLAQEEAGSMLLLIEEPEAHVHAQRQLRVMRYLQEQAKEKDIQVIVTTHSPNLASAIDLNNLVMICNRRAFPMCEGHTQLEPSDYRFLERFLDATKANLFFARGVMIVEGDAENILIPTLATLIGRDFTEHGVSIVNVGGVGLRRYARIFQREDVERDGKLEIPVACVTDMDVMPDCARGIIDKKSISTKSELGGEDGLQKRRDKLCEKASGQCVRTFVSDEWTLEYDLAYASFDEDVYVAAHLAKKDEALDEKKVKAETKTAIENFNDLKDAARVKAADADDEGNEKDLFASMIYSLFTEKQASSEAYAKFTKGQASKTITAQYLAQRLRERVSKEELTADELRERLPKYLVKAIDYVTAPDSQAPSAGKEIADA